ncbi:MAG: peptide chain release factor 2, partial [Ruminococcus sp.]|nr:peptide chain release factor 2 [Ruminococcus sp.]
DAEAFKQQLEAEKLRSLLTGEYDNSNAILTLHAGAGGTEAQDWSQMLYRMYNKYAETHGFKVDLLDWLDGDEAGIKSASFMVEGENAYGFLKSEAGVHRLVRVSPFDSSGRRHTSFAALEVMPELSDDVEVEIRPEDIEMQVYRSSGAGGQHINKTSSAIRITHLPTGTVVECQDERSQYKNKDKALKVLKSRLLKEKQDAQASEIAADRKSQVGTGDRSERIRTYNYPQGRLTDHRIGLTLYKLEDILNGNLDEVIDALVTADRAEKLKESMAQS